MPSPNIMFRDNRTYLGPHARAPWLGLFGRLSRFARASSRFAVVRGLVRGSRSLAVLRGSRSLAIVRDRSRPLAVLRGRSRSLAVDEGESPTTTKYIVTNYLCS